MTLVYDVRSQKANNSTTTTTALQDPNIPSFDDVQAVKMYRVFAPLACGDYDNTTIYYSYWDLRTWRM